MKNKRVKIAILTGAILGIFCIIGISYRMGFEGNQLYILSAYLNRIIIGLVIGLAPYYKIKETKSSILLRGFLLGLLISGSLYIATGFIDFPGFIAGVVYGIIIDHVASKYGK